MRKYRSPGFIHIFFTFCISLISSCTDVKPTPAVDHSIIFSDQDLFGTRPTIISEDEIFRLSEDQQREFLQYFNSINNRDVPTHWRVYNYLQRLVAKFNYQENTYTAEAAVRLSSGNCLSLAIITTALARLANIDIGYQLIDDIPVYERSGQVIFKGVHLRSLLYQSQTGASINKIWIGSSVLKVDYFQSGYLRVIKNISDTEFIAMYYRNKAAEAIGAGDYATAYWLTDASLKYEPDSMHAINMMAVIYHHANHNIRAEQIYKHGIKHADDKLSLLKNYHTFLVDLGRFEEARQISKEMAGLDDPSPFSIIEIADEAYNSGNYSAAVLYYKKATVLAPYLHEGYFGLSKSYYQLGDLNSAERNMRKALEHAFNSATKTLYKAKLMALSQNKRSEH